MKEEAQRCWFHSHIRKKKIWYMEKRFQDNSQHNIGGPVRIKGPIDFDKLEEVIKLVNRRHEGIRLRLKEVDEEASWYIADSKILNLERYDFTRETDPEVHFQQWVDHSAATYFSLEN
ncbi:hypothetical protein GK047_11980 [Paenibacillus sp. SYP-B3998]|uniref:Condensation domain-containing protein n=2 Tax=Paenibacillus sp. SYP-B3998 TaxID=2678564 RepID=A0A6G3ZWZ3_9BACL|nr:hypothetical protein [Paenibacillus sp. SYP-B3998]